MRVGLIARSEHRGLGVQTLEVYRHLNPFKVLLIDMARDGGYEDHPDWFPGATVLPYRTELDLNACRKWLQDLDVVYSAETFYDWRMVELATKLGVATVCHVNPEFYKHGTNQDPHPTVWWSATNWRLDQLAGGTRVVPMPIPLDRWPAPAPLHTGGTVKWLHVQGKRALADRNGTDFLWKALRRTKHPHEVTVCSQHPRKVSPPRVQRNVHIEVRGPVDDYWTLYPGHDALILPRRYGGLCLPVLEAMGAGLGIMMTDMEPQRSTWPIEPVKVQQGRLHEMPGGPVEVAGLNPNVLARQMDSWSQDPTLVAFAQARSRMFAQANSWEALLPRIREELSLAVARVGARMVP